MTRRSSGGRHQGARFTERDREVGLLLVAGLSNAELAAALQMERHSVEDRINRLYQFFGIDGTERSNRVKLALAIRNYLESVVK